MRRQFWSQGHATQIPYVVQLLEVGAGIGVVPPPGQAKFNLTAQPDTTGLPF
jgi:hypothetical protein